MVRRFILFCVCLFLPVGGERLEVMEGDSFTLRTGLAEIKSGDEIEWTFEQDRTRIIRIASGKVNSFGDTRFRDRLQLNERTGDLTIANVSKEHSGTYGLSIIISNKVEPKQFTVAVYVPLFAPVITKYSSRDSSSSSASTCVLVCLVVNVSHVTLSWLKGNSLLSSISASDLSISLSLPLEVEYQDNNTYSCQIKNPIRHQITHLDINDLCSDPCDTIEPVIRLVVTALMGVAAVAAIVVLVYDIRSRTEAKRTNLSTRRQQRNRMQ